MVTDRRGRGANSEDPLRRLPLDLLADGYAQLILKSGQVGGETEDLVRRDDDGTERYQVIKPPRRS